MEDGLPDLGLGQAVAAGPADVDGQLGRPVEGHQHAQVEEGAVAAGQARARPGVPPAPLGHQLLAGAGELGAAVGEGPVDVDVADDGPAHGQPGVEETFVERSEGGVGRRGDLGLLLLLRHVVCVCVCGLTWVCFVGLDRQVIVILCPNESVNECSGVYLMD